ncbi:MAG: C39 family peptidase, partial [Leuconostoc pseudomesenteroides]
YGQNKTVYYNDNGQMLYGKLVIKNTVYTFNNQNGALYFNPYYYAQNNILWGNVRFGNYTMAQTGCVMASLAMVITGYGNNITPLQAATFGYNHGTFNHGEPGTDQNTLVAVAKHYGLTPRGLNSKSQLQDALENGRPVVIAVQQPFIPWYGVTHEIVVSKYSSGKVYVQDPLGTTTGWHTLSSLWNYRSTVREDSEYFSTPAVELTKR